jgi:hypothetical protein
MIAAWTKASTPQADKPDELSIQPGCNREHDCHQDMYDILYMHSETHNNNKKVKKDNLTSLGACRKRTWTMSRVTAACNC